MAAKAASGPHGLLAAGLFTAVALGADLPAGYSAAPYYPSPYTGWVDSWSDSVQKAKALVDTMTLAEKANITSGTGIYMGEFCRILRLIAFFGCHANNLQSKCLLSPIRSIGRELRKLTEQKQRLRRHDRKRPSSGLSSAVHSRLRPRRSRDRQHHSLPGWYHDRRDFRQDSHV